MKRLHKERKIRTKWTHRRKLIYHGGGKTKTCHNRTDNNKFKKSTKKQQKHSAYEEKTIYKDKKATDEEKIPLNPICCFYICIYLLILQEERMAPRSENRTIICSQSITEPFPITPDSHEQHGAGWASLYLQTGMYHRTRMPKILNSGIM